MEIKILGKTEGTVVWFEVHGVDGFENVDCGITDDNALLIDGCHVELRTAEFIDIHAEAVELIEKLGGFGAVGQI